MVMTCYCLCCTTAFLSCCLVLETFTLQAENFFCSLIGAELVAGLDKSICVICHWEEGEKTNNSFNCKIIASDKFNFVVVVVVFCLLFYLKCNILEVIFFCRLLMCRHWIVFLKITAVFCTSHSFYSANSYTFSCEEKNWEGKVLSEKQWSKT